MVGLISLAIPNGADVEDPIKDAAFMTRIGANPIRPKWFHSMSGPEYGLKNEPTGTLFTFFRLIYNGVHQWVIIKR